MCFGLCFGCSSSSKTEEKEKIAEEVSQEVEVGRNVAARLIGRFSLEESSSEWVKYVNLMGALVATEFGRSELKFHFAILKSPDINAFAAPGGYLFVTKGLLKELKSEAELVAILAHEVGHVNEKHVYNKIQPKNRERGFTYVFARLLSFGAADLSGAIQEAATQGMELLVEKGLDPKAEFEADEAGVVFASTLGYDPRGLSRFLGRTTEAAHDFPKTHPAGKEREKLLAEILKKNKLVERYLAIKEGARFEVTQKKRFDEVVLSTKKLDSTVW